MIALRVDGPCTGAPAAPSADAVFASACSKEPNTLGYGDLSLYFQGLEGVVGPPSVSLSEAIEREHCAGPDSFDEFEAPNYGTQTMSCIEYHFVMNGEDGIKELERYPTKVKATLYKDDKGNVSIEQLQVQAGGQVFAVQTLRGGPGGGAGSFGNGVIDVDVI